MRSTKSSLTAPRIALLVHNRLENDPRVSRHATAAARAGYRVAVLSVGAAEGGRSRWGDVVNGVAVFESRILRVSGLGRLRAHWRRRGGRASDAPEAAPQAGEDAFATQGPARGLRQAARDLWTITMLLRNNVGVFRQFRGLGARIVHANDLNVLFAGYLLARAWGAALLYDSHELWTQLDESWSPFLRRLFALVEGPLLRRADAVVTVNAPIARELARAYGAPLPLVVMNCPELPAALGPVQDAPPDRPLAVIYQGMLNYRGRGLEGLIDAAAQVDGVTLTLRGPGSLAPALQRRIDERRAQNVHMLPPVPMADLIDALEGYDVGVVSYLPLSKNFLFCSPNKLFEYMMAGLAVICSDLPVLRDVVDSAQCGLLYEPGNGDALATALRRLACDRALLARCKANARRAALERYNAAREEGTLLDLYARLTAAPGDNSQ